MSHGHPLYARLDARQAASAESKGIADRREQLLAGLTGRVLEVGAGSGLGFAQFPASVTELVAIEPEPYLRRLAQAAASGAPFRSL